MQKKWRHSRLPFVTKSAVSSRHLLRHESTARLPLCPSRNLLRPDSNGCIRSNALHVFEFSVHGRTRTSSGSARDPLLFPLQRPRSHAEQSGPLAASSTAVWKSTHFLLKMTNCGCLNRASNVVPVQFSVCHSSVNRLSSSDGNAGLLNSAPKRDALFATFLHRPLIPASQAERLDQPFASSAQAPEELFKELTRIQQC